jgi:hypothetical protein
MTVREDAVAEAFYGECSPEDVALARMLLAPEAVARTHGHPRHGGDSFGSVPNYVECVRDRAPRSSCSDAWLQQRLQDYRVARHRSFAVFPGRVNGASLLDRELKTQPGWDRP